jgi:Porin PorA
VELAVDQNVRETLQDSSGTTRLVLLQGDFKTTTASVASAVKTDKSGVTQINVLNVILPIVAGLLGIVLVVVGLVLSWLRPEDEEYEDDDEVVGVPA